MPLDLHINPPVCLLGMTKSSDGAKTASDNIAGVPIAGCSGVLFILGFGPLADGEATTFQIQYAADGLASNAATSNAAWTCTDATLTCSTDTAITGSTNGGYVAAWFDVSAKNLSDRAGKLYATRTASENPASLIAIPITDTGRLPTAASSDIANWTSTEA